MAPRFAAPRPPETPTRKRFPIFVDSAFCSSPPEKRRSPLQELCPNTPLQRRRAAGATRRPAFAAEQPLLPKPVAPRGMLEHHLLHGSSPQRIEPQHSQLAHPLQTPPHAHKAQRGQRPRFSVEHSSAHTPSGSDLPHAGVSAKARAPSAVAAATAAEAAVDGAARLAGAAALPNTHDAYPDLAITGTPKRGSPLRRNGRPQRPKPRIALHELVALRALELHTAAGEACVQPVDASAWTPWGPKALFGPHGVLLNPRQLPLENAHAYEYAPRVYVVRAVHGDEASRIQQAKAR